MNKKTLAWAACLVFSLVSGMPAAQAQTTYPPPPQTFSQQQLDQMVAPVALYPDDLLAQVLMASTYPLEVVQAQRFVEARPGLQGDALARSVAPMPWDPSVKALVQFPAVLAMMNDRLDWMQQLGQAFLADQGAVMDTVQNLRMRAQQAGNLQSSPQQRVLYEDDLVVIEPVNPQVVYVPYYNPTVVYGSWWWPSAPPVYWTPPPRYRPPHYAPGVSVGITFGSGIGVMRASFGEARPDWRQRQVFVTQTRVNQLTNNNTTINRNVVINNRPVVWRHDPRYVNRNPQQPGPQAPGNSGNGGPPNQPPRGPQTGNGPPPGIPLQGQQPQRPNMSDGRPDNRPDNRQNFRPPERQQDRGPEQRPQPTPPQAAQTPQQRVIQEDRARERQVRDQQMLQQREVNAQQRQREEMARDQQRRQEDAARQQHAQQQQQQHQQMMQMQQRQDQMRQQQDQMRQQQEHARREQQQERVQHATPPPRPPEQPRAQPQQQPERQPHGERRRPDDNR